MHSSCMEILISAFLAAFIAQFIKVVTYIVQHKSINFKIITTTGGMPSSHSAFVIALSTCAGLLEGFDSTMFAVSLGFALIVMYDAAGVRRSAGKMAASLNRIMAEVYKTPATEKLKELLGHTPIEVLAGAALGIFVGYGVHNYL